MSDTEERNDKQSRNKKDRLMASFSSSAPVVVHRTNRSIRSLYFLNMNDYCTGVLAKLDNKE